MPNPSLLHPKPLSLRQSPADPYLLRGHSNTVLSQSLWGLWVLVYTRFVEPFEHLWRVWGLILNMISPLLPSCWGFSFVPGRGIFPNSCSSAKQPLLQGLLSYWGFSALGYRVPDLIPHETPETTWPASWEICMQVRKQQLEVDMEQ